MHYRGKMKGGVVVLEPGASLPEGADVNVEPINSPAEIADNHQHAIWDKLLKLAGSAPGLPEDAAAQHDHYLYGIPKR